MTGLNDFAPAAVKQCRAIEGDERCTDTGIYRTWLDVCAACREELGVLFCQGHSFCVQHAAEVRTGARQFEYDDVFVVVTRMTGIAA